MTQYREVDDNELMTLYGARPSAPQSQQPQLAQTPQPAQFVQNQLAPVAPPVQRTAPVAQAPVAQAPALSDQAPAPDMNRMAQSVLRTQQQMQQRPAAEAQNPVREAIDYITDNWEMFAIPSAAVAANYAVKNLSPSKRSIVDRMFNLNAPQSTINSPMAVDRVDPVMDTMNPVQKMDIDVKRLDPEWQKIIAQSEANRVSKERELEQRRQQRQQAAVDRINQVPEAIGNPTPKSPNPIPDVVASTMPTQPAIEVPTVADIGKQALGVAPVEPPVTTNQIVSEAITPPSEKKKGRPVGAKNLTPEQKAAAQASKGTNMYLNMFGFDKNDPTSPKSLAAIESTNRFINEAMGGVAPASRDPLLNPQGDVGPSGKKFYSGTPEGYRNAYIPWLQQNLNTLPPETQSHVLQAMTKGQTGDISKIAKGLGLAGLIGASGAAFSAPSQTRGRDIANAIGEAVLPLGLTPSTLQSGVLPPEIVQQMMAERQKLGSPFRGVAPPQ